jgi:hypothetical protein
VSKNDLTNPEEWGKIPQGEEKCPKILIYITIIDSIPGTENSYENI